MLSEVLSEAQVDQFVVDGCCVLRRAFTAEQAAAACRCLWRRIEEKTAIREADPATWPAAYDIEEHLDDPEVLACFSDRLAAAVEQLVGRDRWLGLRRWGLWPVNFSYGADSPLAVPSRGWHIDGNWFHHTLDAAEQGLLIVGLFTNIEPGWGGTVVSLGSHRRTACVLADHPAGLHHLSLFDAVLSEPLGNFREVTGRAGDVVLAHPFLFHTRGFKRAGPPRVISNTEATLRSPMRVSISDLAMAAPVEAAIHRALTGPIPAPEHPLHCRF